MKQFKYNAIFLAYVMASQSALAQETTADIQTLETIEVTAQKRTTNLQETPISISAMSGEKIAEAGIPEMGDFALYIPNFSVTPHVISDIISVRGIQSGILASIEQSVGTFVDGVYRGRGVQSRFSFLDVGMVEVLRGPQSTLFGKNTIGGALNITSAAPTEDFQASVSALYEFEHEETELQGYISGPVSDTFRGRLALMSRTMDKGWIENAYYNEDHPINDEWAGRASFEWDATDDLLIKFKYEHGEWDNDGMPFEETEISPSLAFSYGLFGINGDTETNNFRTTMGNNTPGIDYGSIQHFVGDIDELAIQADYSMKDGVLTAIAGHSSYQFERDFDADFNAFDALGFEEDEDFNQNSLEIRYVANKKNGFEYLVGGFYQTERLNIQALSNFNVDASDPDSFAGPAGLTAFAELAPIGQLPDLDGDGQITPNDGLLLAGTIGQFTRMASLDQNTESWAVFTQGSYDLSEQWKITVGLRYGNETKDGSQGAHCTEWDTTNILDPSTCPPLGFVLGEFTPHQFDDLSRDENDVNYSVNLSYQLDEDTLIYANVANGNKSGGFNSFALSASREEAEFDQEEVVSYEIGSKLTLADGAAELNFAIFDMDYDDLQASIFTGATGFKVENAAEASISGIELDGRWLLSENLMLRGSLGYIDFKFDKYDNAGCTSYQQASLNDGTFGFGTFVKPVPGTTGIEGAIAVDLDGDGLTDTCEQNLAGATNAYTPEWTGAISLEYEKDISSDYYIRSVLDYNYMGDHHTAQDNDRDLFQDAYGLVNFSITLGDSDGNWDVSFLARNLFDEQYRISSGDLPLFSGSKQVAWGRPANYSLRLRVNY